MKILRQTLSALFASLACMAAGCAQNTSAPSESRENFIRTIDALGTDGKTRFIVLTDPNHASIPFRKLIADKQVLRALERNGFKISVNEGPIQGNAWMEKLYKDIRRGRISAEDLCQSDESIYHINDPEKAAQYNRALANFLVNTAKAGMLIYYPDARYNTFTENPELYDHFLSMACQLTNDEIYDHINLSAYINAMTLRGTDKNRFYFLQQDLEKFFEYSDKPESDQKIANNILRKAGKSKAFIIYGACHIESGNDLDEMLGAENTATFYFFDEPDSFMLARNFGEPDANYEEIDLPRFTYDISTDNITPVEGSVSGTQAFRARIRDYISEEEYNDTVSQLPPELRDYAWPYSRYDDNPCNDAPAEPDTEFANRPGSSAPEPGA